MRFARVLAAVTVIGAAGGALAQEIRIEGRRSSAAVVIRDAIAGGVLGCAVAGGIIFYEMGVNDDQEYDWGRTLAWGAAIGVGAGLLWGIVDVSRASSYAAERRAPVHDGLSISQGRRDRSGAQRFPLLVKRF